MTYNFNGKNIQIPDAEIQQRMTAYELTREEAIQLWLEDEDYLENEVVEELTAKAKVNKVSHDARADKPRKPVQRERKLDEEKVAIVNLLAETLTAAGYETVNITNIGKIIEFNVGENHYKLDLIKQRPPKK